MVGGTPLSFKAVVFTYRASCQSNTDV